MAINWKKNRYAVCMSQLSQEPVHWQQAQNCKINIGQHCISMRLKRREDYYLFYPLRSPWLRLLSNPWNLTRLGSHDWTGEGLRQSGRVPLIPAWDSALCWDTKEAALSERGFSWGPQQQETWRLGEFQGPRGQSVRPPSFGCTRIYGASQGKPLRG